MELTIKIKVDNSAAKGWLLPMLYFDMGPNNLFRLLRQGAVDAYGMGRGVTVPVFHRYVTFLVFKRSQL